MRRTTSAGLVTLLLLLVVPQPAGSADDGCGYGGFGDYACHISGSVPGDRGRRDRFPIRFLYTTRMEGVDCFYWSRRPGGIDVWDPSNDPTTIRITTGLAECVWPDAEDRAWEIFRSFPLPVPRVRLQPEDAGIVNLPTYLSLTRPPEAFHHLEALPDGRILEVVAEAVALEVDWGDGTVSSHLPDQARPYPTGEVTHPYRTRTCPHEERATTSGGPCHPTLEAYRIVVTLIWQGHWRTNPTGPYQPLDTIDRTTTIHYPIDEIQGVLVDP